MPFLTNSLLNRLIKLSYLQSEMSLIWRRVGSLFIPAPPEQISFIYCSLHNRTISTFASKLSMQSITQSTPEARISLALSTVTQLQMVSIWTWGKILFIQDFRQCTFDVPTSLRTAQLCLFKLLSVTLSKSTILTRLMPDRTSILTTCDPTPPTPSTITDEFSNFLNFSSPKYLMILANCSFLMASYCSDQKSI